jgi:hypothetical protein
MLGSSQKPETPALPAALRARILAASAQAPAPNRTTWRLRALAIMAAGVLGSLALFALIGGVHAGGRPHSYLFVLTGVWLAVLCASVAFAWPRPTSVSAQPSSRMVGAAAIAIAAVSLLFVGVSVAWPDAASYVAQRHDLRCAMVAGVFATPTLIAFAVVLRNTHLGYRSATVVGAATVTWLMGALLIALRCDCAAPEHLALGHVLPLAVGTVVSSFAWLQMRKRAAA